MLVLCPQEIDKERSMQLEILCPSGEPSMMVTGRKWSQTGCQSGISGHARVTVLQSNIQATSLFPAFAEGALFCPAVLDRSIWSLPPEMADKGVGMKRTPSAATFSVAEPLSIASPLSSAEEMWEDGSFPYWVTGVTPCHKLSLKAFTSAECVVLSGSLGSGECFLILSPSWEVSVSSLVSCFHHQYNVHVWLY